MTDLSCRDGQVLRLFPGRAEVTDLRGLYLDQALRPAGTATRPFVYASFIASLDGRISLPDPDTRVRKAPAAITNPRDWRLVQELAASADVVVTSGRYIRDLVAGVAQAGLPVNEGPEFADLLEWRRVQGLAPQPAVAIVTDDLALTIPETLRRSERRIYVATGASASSSQAEALAAQGARVLIAGSGTRVQGCSLVAALAKEGFGTIDMIAGAELLNTLLLDHAFDRLYLTQACRILGGLSFDTLLKGNPLDPPADFKLRSLCYDAAEGDGVEQLFAVFDRSREMTPG